jgi:hypothetical protein
MYDVAGVMVCNMKDEQSARVDLSGKFEAVIVSEDRIEKCNGG